MAEKQNRTNFDVPVVPARQLTAAEVNLPDNSSLALQLLRRNILQRSDDLALVREGWFILAQPQSFSKPKSRSLLPCLDAAENLRADVTHRHSGGKFYIPFATIHIFFSLNTYGR